MLVKRRGYLWTNLREEIEQMFSELGAIHEGDVRSMLARSMFKYLPSIRERRLDYEEYLENQTLPFELREGLARLKREEMQEAIKHKRGDVAHVQWDGNRVDWKQTVANKKAAGICLWPQCKESATAGVIYCDVHLSRLTG